MDVLLGYVRFLSVCAVYHLSLNWVQTIEAPPVRDQYGAYVFKQLLKLSLGSRRPRMVYYIPFVRINFAGTT